MIATQVNYGARQWVKDSTILIATVGSGVHGIALDGTDDHDEMGICIEPMELVVGLQTFEQFEFRTALERHRHDPEADQRYQGRTPPSQAGDLDLVIYSLRKYARLAAANNPSILVLLFAPAEMTKWGVELRARREMFASRQAGLRFLGYLKAQRERMLGTRGQMRVTRTELIQEHGFDTKYAGHAVRLGYQGVEYLNSGALTLPLPGLQRERILAIRRGEVAFDDVIAEIETIEGRLKGLVDTSPLPKHPDHKAIDRFLVEAYAETWGR